MEQTDRRMDGHPLSLMSLLWWQRHNINDNISTSISGPYIRLSAIAVRHLKPADDIQPSDLHRTISSSSWKLDRPLHGIALTRTLLSLRRVEFLY